jgi:hypothetical protein
MKTKSKTNSYPSSDGIARRLKQALSQFSLVGLARQTGFQRRSPQKLTPLVFLQSCLLILLPESASLRNWAIVIGLVKTITYSKQALFKRLHTGALLFVQGVLGAFLARASLGVHRVLHPALERFPRVIIQDSVVLTLSPKLAACFPGARNQAGPQGAMIRVQTLLDVKHERFIHFWHSAFIHNDAKAAPEGLELLRPGDLLLRDLGYFVLSVLRQLMDRGIKFLSRWKIDACLFNLTGQPLGLVGALRHQGWLDQEVLLGAKEQLKVRLVALPVPEAEANRRRRLAKQNRRYRPSAKHLFLLSWNLYVTNVGREVWSAKVVGQVYKLRWRVETIFKAWKSHFELEHVPAGSPEQVQVLLYARLLFIGLFEVYYLAWWDYRLQWQPKPPISLLKLAALMRVCVAELLHIIQPRVDEALAKQIAYHCTYEQRQRKHFIDMLALQG